MGIIFIFIGVLFSFLSGLGILRMPDILNRLQAGTKASTLGLISVAIGGIFLFPQAWFKFVFIAIFVIATNPISSHNLARAAYSSNSENKEKLILEKDMLKKGEKK
ncbi:monovalent cation/H(+) antiporter subunit G [bacterium]|nr:monovalent cation/H(+) antiporter subunit G [bacterium]